MEKQPNKDNRQALLTSCEHPLGQLVVQTFDRSQHNRAVRALLSTSSILLMGSKLIVFCPDCGDDLQISTQAITIDPLV